MDAKSVVRDASELAEGGAFDEAIVLLEGSLREGSCKEATIYETLAQCYLATERPAEAYPYALEATIRDSSWADAYVTCARAARNAGYPENEFTNAIWFSLVEESLRAFVRAFEIQPSDETETELEEMKLLRCRVVAERMGIGGLRVLEDFGSGVGPGSVIWECAFHLVKYLKSTLPPIRGMRVLELGSGTGVVGIACGIMGAHVTLTDQTQLLSLMQGNIDLNWRGIQENKGTCICKPLEWGQPLGEVLQSPWDWVIGADLVYSEAQIELLMRTLRELRRQTPGCRILISHKCRNDVVDQKFLRELKSMHTLPTEFHKHTSGFHILSG